MERQKASRGRVGRKGEGKTAELNALNAHLTASLHFSVASGWREVGRVVIHNCYPCGILNIARADKKKRAGEQGKRPRKAENGTRSLFLPPPWQESSEGSSGLELKMARQ